MTSRHKTFLLTSEWQDRKSSHILYFYGVTENGIPVEIEIKDQQPVIFVARDHTLPSLPFPVRRREVKLKNFAQLPVDALYFRTQGERRSACQLLSAAKLTTYEADVQNDRRFLMERFINAQVEVSGAAEQKGQLLSFVNPHMTPCEVTPPLVLVSLDIETGVDSDQLYSIAAHVSGNAPEQRRVFMVDKTYHEFNETLTFCPSPEAALRLFINWFRGVDPDIIIGWNVIGFDLHFLDRKCREFGIPFTISRNERPIRLHKRRKSGLWTVDISGRAVLDGPQMLRAAYYGSVDYRLETISQKLLGRGKAIASEADQIREIDRMFTQDKQALAHYNLEDCILVTDIFSKIGLIDLQVKRSQITGLMLMSVGISSAEFDHIYLPRLHRRGFVAPNTDDVHLDTHAAGGYVMEPVPGIHDHVVLLDFKSLYPSIIQTFKIEPLARLMSQVNPLTTPNGFRFSRTENVMPEVITRLMEQRAAAWRSGDAALSHAIKILMNSFYGVMGSDVSRFYHPDLPAAITGTARWLMLGCRAFLEERGYRVLYGDTDSLFVNIPPEEALKPDTAGLSLANALNNYWDRKLAGMGLKGYMELEYEKYYRKFVLPLARGKEGGARKRYAGLRQENGIETLEFTGMEYVRTDWTPLAKEFQYQLYQRVLNNESIKPWLNQYLHDLLKGNKNHLLVYHKRLRKPVDAYTSHQSPQVRAARLLIENKISRDVRDVRYVITRKGPIPLELHPLKIDYHHYIEKQLRPVAESLLGLINMSFDDLMRGVQLSLFPDGH